MVAKRLCQRAAEIEQVFAETVFKTVALNFNVIARLQVQPETVG